VLLFSGDLERMIDFYTRVLGLKLSDRCPGIIAFLRCTPDHHNLALLASKGPGFHHGSFEVGGVDEIAMGMQRAHDRRHSHGLGVGRHVIGSNSSITSATAWGSWRSTSTDLDHIRRRARGSRATSRRRTRCIAGVRRCRRTRAEP